MRPNLRRSDSKFHILADKPDDAGNHLIQKTYFLIGIFSKLTIAGEAGQQLDAVQIKHGDIRGPFLDFADRKTLFALRQSIRVFCRHPVPRRRPTGVIAGSGRFCHLNLTHCGDTKSSMRRDVILYEKACMRTSI